MKPKILIVLFAFLFLGAGAIAQTLKIGYTNADYIISLLPETKELDSQLKEFEQQLSNQLQSKIDDLFSTHKKVGKKCKVLTYSISGDNNIGNQ